MVMAVAVCDEHAEAYWTEADLGLPLVERPIAMAIIAAKKERRADGVE